MELKSTFGREDFTVDTRDGISIIKVNIIRVTNRDSNELMRVLNLLLESNQKKLVIDFSNCQFADSIIIGVLIITLKRLKKLEGDIRLVLTGEYMVDTFSKTRLNKIFKHFRTIEQALEGF
jgi:anti-anti-sigma factor